MYIPPSLPDSAHTPTAPPRQTNILPIDMRPAELYSYTMMS